MIAFMEDVGDVTKAELMKKSKDEFYLESRTAARERERPFVPPMNRKERRKQKALQRKLQGS